MDLWDVVRKDRRVLGLSRVTQARDIQVVLGVTMEGVVYRDIPAMGLDVS